ncbi:hypothetical protein N9251_02550 [Gammaproteobacteria bacterium]|nr:hypothetical protein [Gammaproteobacteria bacterium]
MEEICRETLEEIQSDFLYEQLCAHACSEILHAEVSGALSQNDLESSFWRGVIEEKLRVARHLGEMGCNFDFIQQITQLSDEDLDEVV